MRDWMIIAAVCLLIGAGLGVGGDRILSRPTRVAANVEPEREKVAEGVTIVNVMSGAKVITYPSGDFIINAPDGGVEIVQMPQVPQKQAKR